MTTDLPLSGLRADAMRRVPDPPVLDDVTEDVGRQRLAVYYLYSALMAGLIDDLAPSRWPPELVGPMRQLDLTRFAPGTARGLDAELNPAERGAWRSSGRQLAFGQLVVNLINQGTFGPLCGDADRVVLAGPDEGGDLDLDLIRDDQVVGTCKARDHWELVAQHLAAIPFGGPAAGAGNSPGSEHTVAHRLKDSGIVHAVSLGTTLAVSVHPLGFAAGFGTRLVQSRLHAGREQADALHRLGEDLRAVRAEADSELDDLRAGQST
jgi:hypothetical protein